MEVREEMRMSAYNADTISRHVHRSSNVSRLRDPLRHYCLIFTDGRIGPPQGTAYLDVSVQCILVHRFNPGSWHNFRHTVYRKQLVLADPIPSVGRPIYPTGHLRLVTIPHSLYLN